MLSQTELAMDSLYNCDYPFPVLMYLKGRTGWCIKTSGNSELEQSLSPPLPLSKLTPFKTKNASTVCMYICIHTYSAGSWLVTGTRIIGTIF